MILTKHRIDIAPIPSPLIKTTPRHIPNLFNPFPFLGNIHRSPRAQQSGWVWRLLGWCNLHIFCAFDRKLTPSTALWVQGWCLLPEYDRATWATVCDGERWRLWVVCAATMAVDADGRDEGNSGCILSVWVGSWYMLPIYLSPRGRYQSETNQVCKLYYVLDYRRELLWFLLFFWTKEELSL